ncbi:MAG: hypothetical protein HZB38_07135 [Planctomycetes bacterium]|nr:hypothetical protein [Planctomycetota bacterium]
MSVRKPLHWAAALVVAVVGTSLCFAQDSGARKGDSSGGYSAIIDNIDMLVENYAKFLGRKYDLNDEQFGFTKQMIRDKVYSFLDTHETDVRELFDEMYRARTGGDMTQEGLVSWGKRVAPIYEEAKKIIETGNNEWREILNDQQRAIHDTDLELMKQSFAETDEKVQRISQGEMTIEEFVKPSGGGPRRQPRKPQVAPPPPPPPQVGIEGAPPVEQIAPEKEAYLKEKAAKMGTGVAPAGEAPPETAKRIDQPVSEGEAPPPQPEGAQPAEAPVVTAQPVPSEPNVQPPPGAGGPEIQPPQRPNRAMQPKAPGKNFESEWEKYVREFIQKYQLNDEQTQKANAILTQCEQQADRILTAKKSELERIESREAELRTAAAPTAAGAKSDAKEAREAKQKESGELAKKKEEILAPLTRIFEDQLKPKLEKLPTRAQREAAEAAAKKAPSAKPIKPGPAAKPAEKPAENKKP